MSNGDGNHPGVEILENKNQLKNGETLFGEESLQNAPFKEPRLFKRAKRVMSAPQKEDKQALNLKRMPFSKNSKKSRTGRRGLPKKGGGGGKGIWGLPGAEITEEENTEDKCDPNYDSDSATEGVRLVSVSPPLLTNVNEIRSAVENLLKEFFEHGDTNETIECLDELNISLGLRYKIIVIAVSLAIDRHDPQREMTSRLIADLSMSMLVEEDIQKAFDELLSVVPDLAIDVPEAASMLGRFMARAVADDCLPPAFMKQYKGRSESSQAADSLSKSEVLLNMKHGIVRLDNVWGVGGGTRPVKALKKRIALLLTEFLSSEDVDEATRCLKELDVPHFHHELVYDAVVMSIEKSTERAAQLICNLLKSLCETIVITQDQMEQGMKRVFEEMCEICIDVPAAYVLLEHLANKMKSSGILSDRLYQELPSRGRKRFVSEGDGGLIKS
ncbi:DgyrCDS854 [Dimorphilus gyrociliatus]|uniref:Programmed cell death protein 4 n=1 Tax=Dimorphilus gyrociliatus TaxID=2664684 RepID=A0A7I8V8M4_9ANNE|nr:DgyrCDS854 [Dimorphilus gyrociliatus]